jgi:hypothetical protein
MDRNKPLLFLAFFTDVKQEGPHVRQMFLTVVHHAHKLSIGYFHPGGGNAKIDILDCRGRMLRTFVDPDRRSGKHRFDFASAIDGLSIVKVQAGKEAAIKKILLY